ncbi:MAG: alpha/beta hydrolase [Clostridia bacterium]|nr:alpha/beta hydrolase [Clostridia bacterium]
MLKGWVINDKKVYTKEKKPLIFLHGYLADSKSFIYQTKFFSRYFEVHALDLKGFGENKNMPYPYSLTDYVNELKNYILANNITKPNIIAHSFGGRIAIKLLATDGELVNRVVLTGSAGLKPKRSFKYRVKKLCYSLLKKFVKKERLKGFYSKDYLSLSPVMQQSFIKIVNEHLDNLLPKIKNKTLIVFGEKDTETPIYMAKKLNKNIKNSKLIIIKGAGHFCFLENPNKFNLEVREFLLSKGE